MRPVHCAVVVSGGGPEPSGGAAAGGSPRGGTAARPARLGPWRREVRAFLELFALAGVAVAQPVFDLLGKNAGLFILWRTTRAQLVALTVLALFAPAVGLWASEVVVGLVVLAARRYAHALLAGLVVVVIAVEALKKTDLGPDALIVAGVAAGALGAFLLLRFRPVGLWLRYLAVAPAIFGLVFLFSSPVTPLVSGSDPSLARVHVGTPSRVVMIVMDEFPLTSLLDGTGRIDAELFPHFAALARDATWYRNDTTVAPFTEEAVPAILTGRSPGAEDTVPFVAEYPRNLFTLLGRAYDMNVHEAVTRLCPSSLCAQQPPTVGVHPGFRGMLVDAAKIWRDFASPDEKASITFSGLGGADRTALTSGMRFVRSLRPTSTPRLDFLHVLLPHFPWHYLRSGQDYASLPIHTNGLVGQDWANDWTAVLGRQRHFFQVQASDLLLGRIVARLRQIGAYDDSLIVLTADHGVAFEGGKPIRGVAATTYPSIMWTPLFVKAPRQVGGVVDDRRARSIDVLPTIADHLDVRVPWHVDGRSLLAPPVPDGPRRLLAWKRNAVRPTSGQKYLTFDGPRGFAAVLRARASSAAGNPALRLYRLGEYGALIGTPAAPLVAHRDREPRGTIDSMLRYRFVVPFAPLIPWADVHGTVAVTREGRPLAIAVNGVVAGLFETFGAPSGGRTEFWGTLPPELFRAGANSLTLYLIEGTPAAPVLRPVRLTA